jgi:hypothetical protein
MRKRPAGFAPTAGMAAAADNDAEQVLAAEKALLARRVQGDTHGFVDAAANEVTYFDPLTERRVDGKSAFRDHLEPIRGKFSIPRHEMQNVKVQSEGGTAVLSYNFVSYDDLGAVTSRWNATEVYRKNGSRWAIIHSHWSRTKPAP